MLDTLTAWMTAVPPLQAAVIASLFAGLAAGIGALPVLIVDRASRLLQDVLLGAAAGIMLGATCFSLLIPALTIAGERFGTPLTGGIGVGAGMMGGALALWAIHRLIPHEHIFKGVEGVHALSIRRIWLFILAITLHNIPEGLAVGVGVGGIAASGDPSTAVALTIGIFLQNLPEGFVVALALLPLGYSRLLAILVALATGVVETIGGFIGAGAVVLSQAVLPWALAGAAGAMLFVISHEVIPETHSQGYETPATFGVVAGFVLMMVLDVGLGVIGT
jgi:ZIP family zinc transporter